MSKLLFIDTSRCLPFSCRQIFHSKKTTQGDQSLAETTDSLAVMMAQFKEKKRRTALQETTNQQAGAPAASQDGNPSLPGHRVDLLC